MLNLLKTYINKPLPYVESNSIKFFMSLFFGVFVFAFLWIFQPFGIRDYPESALLKSLGYGIVTFIIMLINSFFLPIVLPRIINPNNFKVKHVYWTSIWFLVSIAIANWAYSNIFFSQKESLELGPSLLITLAVGVFPMLFGGYFMERKLNEAKQKIANVANNYLNRGQNKPKSQLYIINSENISEQFELDSASLVYIMSDGNYCEFYYHTEGVLEKQLLRITLKLVEEKLQKEQEIIQCHRSYLVNLRKVKHVSGTARNLSLHFDNMELTVPVSRSRELFVTEAIRHLR